MTKPSNRNERAIEEVNVERARRGVCLALLLGLAACGRGAPAAGDAVESINSALTSGAVQVNCGGPAVGSFVADTGFSGGATLTRTNTIDLSGVASPPPMALYQSQRYNNMSYTFGGFAAGSLNDVRLHWADTKWTTSNQRLFNVTINGQLVLFNFDIIGTAGAPNKAVAETFTLPASSTGQYVIQFVGTKDAAMICGIEITPAATGTCAPSPLSRTGWIASASLTAGSNPASNAIDGSLSTRWFSGAAQASGQYFQLDLQTPQTFGRIVMNAGSTGGDYAHKFNVFVSNDGVNFGTAVASGTGLAQIETVDFPTQTARYVRVVLSGAASNTWSIYDMNVYPPGCALNSGASAGSLTIGGTLKTSSGTPIVGGRINLSGAAQAIRFTDFSGGYVFHVNPGTYTLTAAAECTLTPSSATFTNITTSKTQAFVATSATCATASVMNVTGTGQQQTLVSGGAPLATTYARVEARTNSADAQARLQEIAAEQPGAVSITVAGNPGIERQLTLTSTPMQLEVEGEGNNEPESYQIVTTAIAIGSSVVRFESQFPADAPATTAQRLLAAGRNFQPEDVPGLHGTPLAPVATKAFAPTPFVPNVPASGAPFGQSDFGELEIAASDVTNAVVYGRQNGPYLSTDGGATVKTSAVNLFAPPTALFVSQSGDPSVVVGAPTGTAQAFYTSMLQVAQAGAPTTLALGLYKSTDNGANFDNVSFPINCAAAVSGCQVPDQPLLAADRVTRAVTSGTNTADQLYVSWRNFKDVTMGSSPAAACSRDGGLTWPVVDTNTMAVSGADFPRMTVAPDGTAVALYETVNANGTYALKLQRWTSCANGFLPFPVVTVNASVNPVGEMPGLDRQTAGNYSASFDDTDPTGKRLFVVFADESAPQPVNEPQLGNDDITVAESLDGGATFVRTKTVNAAHGGHKFFPRACTTKGVTYLTWYDRRKTVLPSYAQSPDLTSYFRSSVQHDQVFQTITVGPEVNVSGDLNDDPECFSGFPRGIRNASEMLCESDLFPAFNPVGTCQSKCAAGVTGPCGSQVPCDPRSPSETPPQPVCATAGENCVGRGGAPKYGDYNGNACAGGRLFMAWAANEKPANQACSVSGAACATSADCCVGFCINNNCSASPVNCTITGNSCGGTAAACCSSSGGNGTCQQGICMPSVGIYTASAP